MTTLRFLKCCLLLFLFVLPFTGCATNKTLTVASTASLLEDISKSANKQSDLRLIREGMPAYLMLIDGMVEAVPNNERLLISAAQGYASFASAFIQDEDKEYAGELYAKAKEYALRALEQIGFTNPASSPFEEFEEGLQKLGKKDVPYIFWSASCWGNWINLNLDSMEALAELPRVESMMKRVLELDEGYHYGGPHIFMGIWFASRPKIAGGDLDRARNHFQKAIELGEGQFLMTYVYYANYYAKKAFDKELFLTTLEKVLQTPVNIVPDLTLLNTVAHTKAEALQNEADDYF